jgi:hypothetical protein
MKNSLTNVILVVFIILLAANLAVMGVRAVRKPAPNYTKIITAEPWLGDMSTEVMNDDLYKAGKDGWHYKDMKCVTPDGYNSMLVIVLEK